MRLDIEALANLNRVVASRIDKNADKMIDKFVVKDRKTMTVGQRVRINDNAAKNKAEMDSMIQHRAINKAKQFRALPPKWSKELYMIDEVVHMPTGKPFYRVKDLATGIVKAYLFDEYDCFPVAGLKNLDVVRIDLASNNSYRRLFGCIIKNRFARWTRSLYQIKFVTLGQRPPKRGPRETDDEYKATYENWAKTIVPLFKSYQMQAPDEGQDSEAYQQEIQKVLHNQYLVESGVVPVDVVTLYFLQLLPGEKDERDEWLKWRPTCS